MSSTEQQQVPAAAPAEEKPAESCQPDGSCACPAGDAPKPEGHPEGCCAGKQCPPKAAADASAPQAAAAPKA